jgi:hypothetical protein
MMKLTANQSELNKFLTDGNKLIQKNNRLFMDNEIISTKILTSLMYKLDKKNWVENLKNSIIIL